MIKSTEVNADEGVTDRQKEGNKWLLKLQTTKSQQSKEKVVVPQVKHCGASVLMWGTMSAAGEDLESKLYYESNFHFTWFVKCRKVFLWLIGPHWDATDLVLIIGWSSTIHVTYLMFIRHLLCDIHI